MRLLRTDCEALRLDTFNDERNLPQYAILSHVWLTATDEITFEDVKADVAKLRARKGWAKLDYTRSQARQDGYDYCWIDTCCIDKSSSAELAEAINSMYRWYGLAEACYVYLADMPERSNTVFTSVGSSVVTDLEAIPLGPKEAQRQRRERKQSVLDVRKEVLQDDDGWDWDAYGRCKWFTRGWTLQELLAPRNVQFFSGRWTQIGSLSLLAPRVSRISHIHLEALQRRWPLSSYSIAQRMSWAARRETTKVEDEAYCLLGIFDLNLPIIYGEGEKAFQRLQLELLRSRSDQTIFAWLFLDPDKVTSQGLDHTTSVYGCTNTYHNQDTETAPISTVVTRPGSAEIREPRSTRQANNASTARAAKSKNLCLLASSPKAFRCCGTVIPVEEDNLDLDVERSHEVTDNGVRFRLPTRVHYPPSRVDDLLGKVARSIYVYRTARNPSYLSTRLSAALKCRYQDDPTETWALTLEKARGSSDAYFAIKAEVQGHSLINSPWTHKFVAERQFTVFQNAVNHSDRLPRQQSKNTVLCDVRDDSELDFKIIKAEPSEMWRSSSSSFCFPGYHSGQGRLNCRLHFESQREDVVEHFIVCLTAKNTEHGWIYDLDIEPQPGTTMWTSPWTAYSTMAVAPPRFVVILSELRSDPRVFQQAPLAIIKIEQRGLLSLCFLYCPALCWILFALSLVPLAVALPVVLIGAVRYKAYRYEEYVWTLCPAEILTLAAGLPLTISFSVMLLLDSKVHLSWQPRSWRQPFLWILRAVSVSLCCAIQDLTTQHAVLPVDLSPRLSGFVAINCLLALPFFLPRHKIKLHRYNLFVFMASLATNISTLYFSLYQAVAHANYYTPFETRACEDFSFEGSLTPEESVDVCKRIGVVNGLFWAIIALGVYQLALECIALLEEVFGRRPSEREAERRRNTLQKLIYNCGRLTVSKLQRVRELLKVEAPTKQ